MIMELLDASLNVIGGLITGLIIGIVTPLILERHAGKSLQRSLYREIGNLYVTIRTLCERIDEGDSAKDTIEHYVYHSLFPLFDLVAKDPSKLERFYQLKNSAAILARIGCSVRRFVWRVLRVPHLRTSIWSSR